MEPALAMSSKPRGRPRKAPSEKLSEGLNVRLTPAEADTLYRLAIKHGQPLNAVLRAILRRFLAQR